MRRLFLSGSVSVTLAGILAFSTCVRPQAAGRSPAEERSQQAAAFFLSHGFHNVYNVSGGIDAWSLEIDPTVPRY